MVSEVIRLLVASEEDRLIKERMVEEGVIGVMMGIRKWVVDQTSKDYKGAIQIEMNVT